MPRENTNPKVSVVNGDDTVYYDGVGYKVDCSGLPDFVHAVQWDNALKMGEVEFRADKSGVRHPNMKIVDFTPYQYLLDRWYIKKAEQEKAKEEEETKAASERAVADRALAEQQGKDEQVRKPIKKSKRSK